MSLSNLELSQIRVDAEDYLPGTCTLQAPTTTPDSLGGWSVAWSDTYSGVNCRKAPLRLGGLILQGERADEVSEWMFTFHHDQELDETWRISEGGATYEINGVKAGHSYTVTSRVLATRID